MHNDNNDNNNTNNNNNSNTQKIYVYSHTTPKIKFKNNSATSNAVFTQMETSKGFTVTTIPGECTIMCDKNKINVEIKPNTPNVFFCGKKKDIEKEDYINFFREVVKERVGNKTGVKAVIEACVVAGGMEKNLLDWNQVYNVCLTRAYGDSATPVQEFLVKMIVNNNYAYNKDQSVIKSHYWEKEEFLKLLCEVAPTKEELLREKKMNNLNKIEQCLPEKYKVVFRYFIKEDINAKKKAADEIKEWEVKNFPESLQDRAKILICESLKKVEDLSIHINDINEIWEILRMRFRDQNCTYPANGLEKLKEFLVDIAEKNNATEVLEEVLSFPFFTNCPVDKRHEILFTLAKRCEPLSEAIRKKLNDAIKGSYAKHCTETNARNIKELLEYFYWCASEAKWASVFEDTLLRELVVSLPGAGTRKVEKEALIYRARAVIGDDKRFEEGYRFKCTRLGGKLLKEESEHVIKLMKDINDKEKKEFIEDIKDRDITHPDILSDMFIVPIVKDLERLLNDYNEARDNQKNLHLAYKFFFPKGSDAEYRGDVCNLLVNKGALQRLESALEKLQWLKKKSSHIKNHFIEEKDREVREKFDELIRCFRKKKLTVKQFRCIENNIISSGLERLAKYCNKTEEWRHIEQDRLQLEDKLRELQNVLEVGNQAANKLQEMRALSKDQEQIIRHEITTEKERYDSLTQEEVEEQLHNCISRRTLEVDGICPGYHQSKILKYFELNCTTESHKVPTIDNITKFIDTFKDFYRKHVVVPVREFWKLLSERKITSSELSKVLNIKDYVKKLEIIPEDTEKEKLQTEFIARFEEEMKWFSKAFNITNQEDILCSLKNFLGFCTSYRNFEVYKKFVELVNVKADMDFSPVLKECYADCKEPLMIIVKAVDNAQKEFSYLFMIPSSFMCRLFYCMNNRQFPDTLKKCKVLEEKQGDKTFLSTLISDMAADGDTEATKILLEFQKVINEMSKASKEVLKGLSDCCVKDAKKLQKFLYESATCDTALSYIEKHFFDICEMHKSRGNGKGIQEIINQGQFIVAEENGVITFFAQVKSEKGLLKYSQDYLEELAEQFIFSQTQIEGDKGQKTKDKRILFPVIVDHLRGIRDVVEELRSIGVNNLDENLRIFDGNITPKKFEEVIDELRKKLKEWRSIVDTARNEHPILYLCPRPFLQRLYVAMENIQKTPLTPQDLAALHEATLQRDGEEFPQNITAEAKEYLQDENDIMKAIANLVLKYFNKKAFTRDTSQEPTVPPDSLPTYCVESHELELTSDKVILYAISIFWRQCSRLPLPVEMLLCCSRTTTLEIEDFIGCWYNWVGHAHTWCPPGDYPFFCIVNAHLLSRPVQDALIQRVARYGANDIHTNRPLLAIFAKKNSTISIQLRQSDRVKKQKQSDNEKNFENLKKKLQSELGDRVLLVYSKEPACGKTQRIKSMAALKSLRMATVAIQRDTTMETVLKKLRDIYSERDNERILIHFDISAFADFSFVNEVFFYLIVLRRLASHGDTVHPVLTDFLFVELPNDGSFDENAKKKLVSEAPMLSLLTSLEERGTYFETKTIQMKVSAGVVVPVPKGVHRLAEVANHFKCTVEELMKTNPGLKTTTKLDSSTLLVPPRDRDMNVIALAKKLTLSVEDILKTNTHIPNKEFVVRPGGKGCLGTPEFKQSLNLSFGSKCLVHFYQQNTINNRSLQHGGIIEKHHNPSSEEISEAITKLIPEAKTTLLRYVAYSVVCTQLSFAFGHKDSLYYSEGSSSSPDYHYQKKTRYYIAKLVIKTVRNMCESAISPQKKENEADDSNCFKRATSFFKWRSDPFAVFSDNGNFSLLTLGAEKSVLNEITADDPDAGFRNYIEKSESILRKLDRRILEKLCLQLEGPQLNIEALNIILPLICLNDSIYKVILARSSMREKPETMSLKEVDNKAVNWLIDFLNKENKNFVESSGEIKTVGDAIKVIDKWLKTLFICPGDSTNTPPYILTPDLLVRMVALKMRMVAGIPVVLSGDQGCGKTLMCEAFARCSGYPYYVLYCNGSVTPSELRKQMALAVDHARRSPNTSVIVQLDEGNCLFDNWTLHQVMCDRVVDGLFIPSNLLFVVMLNPTKRRNPKQQARFDKVNQMGGMNYVSLNKNTEDTGEIPARKRSNNNNEGELVYDVSPTPASVLGLGFNFGSAASTYSSASTYIGERRMVKYIPLSFEKTTEVSDEMRFAINEVQFMIDRLFEPCCDKSLKDAFTSYGDKDGIATFWPAYRTIVVTCLRAMQYWLREIFEGEESVVSLRDIRKVCKLIPFVMQCFLVRHKLTSTTEPTHADVFGFLTKATVCALIMTYYLRLDDEPRPKVLEYIWSSWSAALKKSNKDLPTTFCELPATYEELYGYFDLIAEYATSSMTKDSDDLAMVTALKENAFLIIACAKLKMDLFIVGCAGSSKSRALSSLLAASETRCPFFEHIQFELDALVFQCTQHTTAGDVNRVAYNAALMAEKSEGKCVVLVLEEVGATVKSKHNPLMTLHNIIDHGVDMGNGVRKKICVIGISNWWLAGAKMGRCNIVHRGLPEVYDLQKIGKEILQTKSSETQTRWLDEFCETVRTKVLKDKVLCRFFGMRDYYHSIKMLKLLLAMLSSDINSISRANQHVVRWVIMMCYGGMPPTPENMKLERELYRRLMKSFDSVLSGNVPATYSWSDNPDSPDDRCIPLCAVCAEMAFQRKWLTYVNTLPSKTQAKEEERMRMFCKHAKKQESPKCEGSYKENTDAPPSAVCAADIAAFTILHSETRHLMVFGDPGAVVELLRFHGLLTNKGPYAADVVFATSERPLPNQLHNVKKAMERGGHLVIQGPGLSALLLEPANMHYIKRGENFYTRLPKADGSSKLVPCHPDFRITMIVSEEEAARVPPPVVQRFTKVTLSYLSSMSDMQRMTMCRIQDEARIKWENKTASLLDLLIPGFSEESLAMLIVTVFNLKEKQREGQDGFFDEEKEVMMRLALSFSPLAWAQVAYSPESEESKSNNDVIMLWKKYFEQFKASASRNYSLKQELEVVTKAFPYSPHILLLTRQPDPSMDYIQQSVKDILKLTQNDRGEILYKATVYGNEPNSVVKFTSELENLRDLLIAATSTKARGLLTVLLDLTSVSSAEDLWATFRSGTRQVVNSDECILHVIVVAIVGDPLVATHSPKTLPRLHYTDDWIVLHVDEISPTIMSKISLRDMEEHPLSKLCDGAFNAVSEDNESLVVFAQQLNQYDLRTDVNTWIYTLEAFFKTEIGKTYINHVKKCVTESAAKSKIDWKRPALRQQRETLRSTYVRYLMHVVQLALLPGLCHFSGSMKIVHQSVPPAPQNTEWDEIVKENAQFFFEIPESLIRCFDYCLQPDGICPERKGKPFNRKLPFSSCTPLIQVLREVIRECTDATNMNTLLDDVHKKIPFYKQLSETQRKDLYDDVVTTLDLRKNDADVTKHNLRELLSFFNISSKINKTKWERPRKDNEALSVLVLESFPTDFNNLLIISNKIRKKINFRHKSITVSVDDIIEKVKLHGSNILSLNNVIAIKALSEGFYNTETVIYWDWLEALAVAKEKVKSIKLLSGLDEKLLEIKDGKDDDVKKVRKLFACLDKRELRPVRSMLCKELIRILNKPKHSEGRLSFVLKCEKFDNLHYLTIRPWLYEMLCKDDSTSGLLKLKKIETSDSLKKFMTQATYRVLEKCASSDIVKALQLPNTKFPQAFPNSLRIAMRLGIILAALNYVATNVGADEALMNALNGVLERFQPLNREWLILFALRQGTSGGAELRDLLPLTKYLKMIEAFKDSEHLTVLIEELENKKAKNPVVSLALESQPQIFYDVLSHCRMLFEKAEPNSIAGWFQTRINEGNIQNIPLPGITSSLEYDILIGDTTNMFVYLSPNGFKYATHFFQNNNSQGYLGTRDKFVDQIDKFTPTTGFVKSSSTNTTSVRKLTPLQIFVLSTLSLCAVRVNRQEENDLFEQILNDAAIKVFNNAKKPTYAAAEFLIELFTDGAAFFTKASGVTSRETIESLCQEKLTSVESCRALAAKKTGRVIELIRDGPEAQAFMEKAMDEDKNEKNLLETPPDLLGYRFLPTPEQLLHNAAMRDDRLKKFLFAFDSITEENADDVLQLIDFLRKFDDVCERIPKLKNGCVDVEELNPFVLHTAPVFGRMAHLAHLTTTYKTLLDNLEGRRFDKCRAEYFLVGQKFIEGLYCGSDRSSFVHAQNYLIKTFSCGSDKYDDGDNNNDIVSSSSRSSGSGDSDNDNDTDSNNSSDSDGDSDSGSEKKPLPIRGSMDLLRVNLEEEMLRVLEEYHTDLTQLCPSLDEKAIDCYITHLTAHLKLDRLPMLPDTCDANIPHNVDRIRKFSSVIPPVPPSSNVVSFLRTLKKSEQMVKLGAFIRHLVLLVATTITDNTGTCGRKSIQHNTILFDLVLDLVLTSEQKQGSELFKTTAVFASCNVEHLLFLSALTWQNFSGPGKPLKDEELVKKSLKDLDEMSLWDLFQAVAIFGQFSTSRTNLQLSSPLLKSLDLDVTKKAFMNLGHITVEQLGALWGLLSEEFWSRDFEEKEKERFTAPSIGNLFREKAS